MSQTCEETGKLKYTSPQEASRVRREMDKRSGAKRGRAYKCEHCGTWHITSKRQMSEKK